jgi:hypothetical protein
VNEKLNKIVVNDTLEYIKDKLILPLLDISLKNYDERSYNVFTEELANIFEEYQPAYFAGDYHEKIGEYYFRSLYDDYVPEEMLIEIIKAEADERFEGIKVYFADFESFNHVVEDSVRAITLKFDYMDELMHLIILRQLNNS